MYSHLEEIAGVQLFLVEGGKKSFIQVSSLPQAAQTLCMSAVGINLNLRQCMRIQKICSMCLTLKRFLTKMTYLVSGAVSSAVCLLLQPHFRAPFGEKRNSKIKTCSKRHKVNHLYLESLKI